MSDWSREAKIALSGVLVAILAVVTGILTLEIRKALGLPTEITVATKPIPFTNVDTKLEPTPKPTLEPIPNISTAPSKYPEKIEIIDPLTVRRINFAHGGTSAIVTGTIGRASEHDFLLGARSEQLMTVSLSSNSALFRVYAPDGSSLSETGNADWSGILPQSGDYRVKVFANGHDGEYRLEVSIR